MCGAEWSNRFLRSMLGSHFVDHTLFANDVTALLTAEQALADDLVPAEIRLNYTAPNKLYKRWTGRSTGDFQGLITQDIIRCNKNIGRLFHNFYHLEDLSNRYSLDEEIIKYQRQHDAVVDFYRLVGELVNTFVCLPVFNRQFMDEQTRYLDIRRRHRGGQVRSWRAALSRRLKRNTKLLALRELFEALSWVAYDVLSNLDSDLDRINKDLQNHTHAYCVTKRMRLSQRLFKAYQVAYDAVVKIVNKFNGYAREYREEYQVDDYTVSLPPPELMEWQLPILESEAQRREIDIDVDNLEFFHVGSEVDTVLQNRLNDLRSVYEAGCARWKSYEN